MVLSAELSAAVLFVDACFDCSELRVEESVVVVRLFVGGAWGIGRRPIWVWPSSFCAGLLLLWASIPYDYSQYDYSQYDYSQYDYLQYDYSQYDYSQYDYSQWEELNI